MTVKPEETTYGDATQITGTALQDGEPFAGQPVGLEGRRYPFEDEFQVLETAITAPDGRTRSSASSTATGTCACAPATACRRGERAYVFPACELSFRARSSRVIRVTQRYRVPRGVRLEQPTIFYVGPPRRQARPARGHRRARAVRAGRYRSTAIVRLPAKWDGRFRYASCFRYTAGSGMGNPRASCASRFADP